jgi:hypothetical protein
MSPEAQRIAIAEACPDLPKKIRCGVRWTWAFLIAVADSNVDVDPLSDLNAMHEAVEGVCEQRGFVFQESFTRELRAVVTRRRRDLNEMQRDYWMAEATAAQRAEAFLRTIGKWEDDK